LQIDDTNEGEVYDGNEKRIESKESELEKFKYNFSKPINNKKVNNTQSEDFKPIHSSKTNNDNNFLEDKVKELKEKNDSVKNNLLSELKLNESTTKKVEPIKRTFQLTTTTTTSNSSLNKTISSNTTSANEPIDYTVKSIDFETAKSLRMLIFGNLNQTFTDDWKNQSFNFSDIAKLKFGIVQKKGGPCGVLASVQAYVLKDLIFLSDEPSKESNMM
jgi:hypothetical protein